MKNKLLQTSETTVGKTFSRPKALSEVQITATNPTGNVSAEVEIFCSSDGLAFISLGATHLSGNKKDTKSDSIERPYAEIYAQVKSISPNTLVTITESFGD